MFFLFVFQRLVNTWQVDTCLPNFTTASHNERVREVKKSRTTETLSLKVKNTEPTQSPSKPAVLKFTRCSDHLTQLANEAAQGLMPISSYKNIIQQK